MDGLYADGCPQCRGTHISNEAGTGINFSAEVLAKALRAIYDGLDVKGDIQRDAFEEMLRIFNLAAAEGLSQADKVPLRMETLVDQIRHNNMVFSAYKVHRMQNDMAARMIDGGGNLKSFEKWKRDVEDIADHYCNRWLKTEYDTAVLRAHQAADWLRFEDEADVYPNLTWMPTTSPDPDPYHRRYWEARLTLPVGHPFWERHHPGDRWNCKCSLRQTDGPPTTGAVADFKPVPPQPGLDNNPAHDGKLFSGTHPYFTQAHPGAKEAAEKFIDKRKLGTAFDEKVTMQVTSIEDEIRMNKKFETAVAVDKYGNIVLDKRGAQYSVSFTRDEVLLIKDCIFTHNHPRGWGYSPDRIGHIGNSFSVADIKTAIVADVAEIRAVTPLYTFSMKRPKGGWGVKPDTLQNYANKKSRELSNEFYKLIENGHLSVENAKAIHFHTLWKRVAKHYNWEYTKMKTRYE